MKEVKPTTEEKRLANDLQTPRTVQGEDAPIGRVNTFGQLAKVSHNARLALGGNAQWIQPAMLFNAAYRQGDESVPFFITRAWQFTSKQGYGERLGLEIALSNGRMYNVALGLSEGDGKRNAVLDMFVDRDGLAIPGAKPLGPVCLHMLPLDRGNDYYDIVPYEDAQATSTDAVQIPFVEINDKDIPF